MFKVIQRQNRMAADSRLSILLVFHLGVGMGGGGCVSLDRQTHTNGRPPCSYIEFKLSVSDNRSDTRKMEVTQSRSRDDENFSIGPRSPVCASVSTRMIPQTNAL